MSVEIIPDDVMAVLQVLLSRREQKTTEKRYQTEEEAEGYTGQSRTSLFRAVRKRELPVIKVGRRTMYETVDLDRWMSAHKIGKVRS